MNDYYVYLYKDVDGEPVYIGKGIGDRARQHLKLSNNDRLNKWIRKRSEQGYLIEPEIVAHGSEDNMLMVEVALIKLFGRADQAKGGLFNNTDGGDGVSNPSDEVRDKMSKAAFERYGGERIFRFKHFESGEIFEGNCPEFAAFLGVRVTSVNRLVIDGGVHSVKGWVLDGSEIKPNMYRKEFDFIHLGTGESIKATQSEFCNLTGLSPSLVNQLVHNVVVHGNGWVLKGNEGKITNLVQNSRGHWYTPPNPWRVNKLSNTALRTWAMAEQIIKAWLKLSQTDANIRPQKLLRSMGLQDKLSARVVENILDKYLNSNFDPIQNDDWKSFYRDYCDEYSLPDFEQPEGIRDGRSSTVFYTKKELLTTSPKKPNKKPLIIEGVLFSSITDAAEKFSVSRQVIGERINKGWSPEQAVGLCPPPQRQQAYNSEEILVDGVRFESISSAAKAYGFTTQQIHKRLKKLGWSVDEAFGIKERKAQPSNSSKSVTINGITYQSMKMACQTYDVAHSTIRRRMATGMTLEEAFTKPLRDKLN